MIVNQKTQLRPILVKQNEYCIRIVGGSTKTPGCTKKWKGPPVEFTKNGVSLGTLPKGFVQEDFCLPLDQVDPQNDIFELSVDAELYSGFVSTF